MYIDLVSIFHRLYNLIDLLVHYIHGYLVLSTGEVDYLNWLPMALFMWTCV